MAHNKQQLTQRELEVLQLLVKGKTHREIAADLFISPHTAREHIARIYAKLGVSRRTDCILKAISMGVEP